MYGLNSPSTRILSPVICSSSVVSRKAAAMGEASPGSMRPPGKLMSPGCFFSFRERISKRTCHSFSTFTSGTITAERKAVSSPIKRRRLFCNKPVKLSIAIERFPSHSYHYQYIPAKSRKQQHSDFTL